MSTALAGFTFAHPLFLLLLVGLPLLWFLLRATAKQAKKLDFPGTYLLLGTVESEHTPARTPWPILLLRCLIAALIIIAFAEPREKAQDLLANEGPLVLIFDGGWASAPDWQQRILLASTILEEAARKKRLVGAILLTHKPSWRLELVNALVLRKQLEAFTPKPWIPERSSFLDEVSGTLGANLEGAEIVYFHDGLDYGTQGALARSLVALGKLHVITPSAPAMAIRYDGTRAQGIDFSLLRANGESEQTLGIAARNSASKNGQIIYSLTAAFAESQTTLPIQLDLPLELSNRIDRIELTTQSSAGSVILLDSRSRRRSVGIVSDAEAAEFHELLTSEHYLKNALALISNLRFATLERLLDEPPDVIILPDGRPPVSDIKLNQGLAKWLEDGGMLIRFSGPELAASLDEKQDEFLPVVLRNTGRALGGVLSWEEPRRLQIFTEDSPFHGLTAPKEVETRRQILAQPGPNLAKRSWAQLTDGTPIVSSAQFGNGTIVLFHISANAEWSSLPLSGLFKQMLTRLLEYAGSRSSGALVSDADSIWIADEVLDADGTLTKAGADIRPLRGLPESTSAEAPPGLYRSGEAFRALNLFADEDTLTLSPKPPSGAEHISLASSIVSWNLKPTLLGLALILWLIDGLISLVIAKKIPVGRLRSAFGPMAVVVFLLSSASELAAEQVAQSPVAALRPTLAYIQTGDPALDRLSHAGLSALSSVLHARTSIEPGEPMEVDPETDELAFYSLLFWPMTAKQPTPSAATLEKLRAYMRNGGMLVIDTRDAYLSGAAGPGTQAFRRFAYALDLPSLEIAPPWHVLRRAYYLIDSFPGRWPETRLWVEISTKPSLEDESPFLAVGNDGVSTIVIGGGDWASIWATDSEHRPLLALGEDGEEMRELAYRFGVNLVMYAYAGNYKADQLHLPALIQRLENKP